MNDCIFCKVISGELPSKKHHEDDTVLVIEDINRQAPVHLLVIPKKHFSDIIDATDEIITRLLLTAKKMIAEKKISKSRVVINGRGAQIIEHLHVHVMGGISKERKL